MLRRRSATAALALVRGAVSHVGCTPGPSAVDAARQQIGRPYTYGGATSGAGFDCSGLTSWAREQAGVTLPRTAAAQRDRARRISRAEAQPGDLAFDSSGGPSGRVSHVALYAGDGRIVHASSSRDRVMEAPADDWPGHLVGFGRVPESALP